MKTEKSLIGEVKHLIVFSAVVFLCVWKYESVLELLKWGWGIFLPFFVGGGMAFLIGIPANYIEQHIFRKRKRKWMKKIGRPVSIFLVIAVGVGAVAWLLYMVIPELGKAFVQLEKSFNVSTDHLIQMIGKMVQQRAGEMIGSAVEMMRTLVRGVTSFFIAVVFACYILMQRETLGRQGKKVVYAFLPEGKAGALIEVLILSGRTFAGFLTGQCVEALILGSMFAVVLLIFRLPYAILIGGIIALTALVPVFGAFVGCGAGVVLIFIEEPARVWMFVVIFLVLQQIEGNLIYPRVVGNSVGLPSIWVLAAVTVGGKLMGIMGMILFIPLAAVSYALFREIVEILLRKRGVKQKDLENQFRE